MQQKVIIENISIALFTMMIDLSKEKIEIEFSFYKKCCELISKEDN
jgi:hypothetical protein